MFTALLCAVACEVARAHGRWRAASRTRSHATRVCHGAGVPDVTRHSCQTMYNSACEPWRCPSPLSRERRPPRFASECACASVMWPRRSRAPRSSFVHRMPGVPVTMLQRVLCALCVCGGGARHGVSAVGCGVPPRRRAPTMVAEWCSLTPARSPACATSDALPLYACSPQDHTFLFAAACFRQTRDPSAARGYSQVGACTGEGARAIVTLC